MPDAGPPLYPVMAGARALRWGGCAGALPPRAARAAPAQSPQPPGPRPPAPGRPPPWSQHAACEIMWDMCVAVKFQRSILVMSITVIWYI